MNYFGREVALLGDVYYSLKSEERLVPNIVGKNFNESEKELDEIGFKIKKRASRPSKDKPDTVLEQLPKAGETALAGQTILVVVSNSSTEETAK